MMRFLIKGILRDKNRSLLPVIVIALGVMLTVFMNCWLNGILGESVEMNAKFNTGHLKVMTRAYAEEQDQMPNDLAILGTGALAKELADSFPGVQWVERIRFGGLIDFPDSSGETRAQGPVIGWAIDLFSNGTQEPSRFNISKSLTAGSIPRKPGEALVSSEFASKFKVHIGDRFTLFGTTMDGGMAFRNFIVAGTVTFGTSVLDRGAVIIDLSDARQAFMMKDAASEILGFQQEGRYNDEAATVIASAFNKKYSTDKDEFAPEMLRLRDQGGLADYIDLSNTMGFIMAFVFVMAMSVVLWNIGLLGGLRRYNEFGVRLAMGEEKKHIYRTLLYEAVLIGLIGSAIGTAAGLGFSYYLQEVGLNLGKIMQNSTLMMPSVAKAAITPTAFYIGFIPGLVSMVLGNALSGIGIYKRQTASLFKELEV
jgi:putative ABC transport system permease protein